MNRRIQVLQRRPRRVSVTLNFRVYQALLERSDDEGRSISNLCAFLLEEAVFAYAVPSATRKVGLADASIEGNGFLT